MRLEKRWKMVKMILSSKNFLKNEVAPAKIRRIRHLHWWDGSENQPKLNQKI
jgi:hypothetical protein